MACAQCQEPLDIGESLYVQEYGDWRQPYLDFLRHWLLSSNSSYATKIKKKSSKSLWRSFIPKVFIQKNLRCLMDKVTRFLKGINSGDCCQHQGDSTCLSNLFIWVIIIGPPWSSMLLPLLEGTKHVNEKIIESTLLQSNCIVYPYLATSHLGLCSNWSYYAVILRSYFDPNCNRVIR